MEFGFGSWAYTVIEPANTEFAKLQTVLAEVRAGDGGRVIDWPTATTRRANLEGRPTSAPINSAAVLAPKDLVGRLLPEPIDRDLQFHDCAAARAGARQLHSAAVLLGLCLWIVVDHGVD